MATEITRWSPLREMATMQNMMDRWFDQNWRPFFTEEGRVGANLLALDIHENDQHYVVKTDLPGVKPENIQIKQEGEYLLIDAEIPEHEIEEGTRSLVKERRYGRYSRRIRLPEHVDFDKADASYNDGILTLNLPKAAEAQPKTIQVKAGNANPQIIGNTQGNNGNTLKANETKAEPAATSTYSKN